MKENLRVCRTCEKAKSPSAFYRDSRYKNGDIHCAECRKAKVKAWRNSNPDRAKEIQRESRNKNPEAARSRARAWHEKNRERHLAYMAERRKHHADKIRCGKLRSAFGISLEQYTSILASQNGQCAICGRAQDANKKRLAVDHCHKTSKVRGLLCSPCNQAIGLFKDSVPSLQSAIQYLTLHQ